MIDLKANPQLLSSSPSGIRCSFIPIDSRWALKCYLEQFDRDEAYSTQTRAAAVGLGPETNGTIDIDLEQSTPIGLGNTTITWRETQHTDKLYCYVTEIVRPVMNQKFNTRKTQSRYIDKLQKRFGERRHQAVEDLYAKARFEFWDDHWNNWGWKNGKLICIDFI